MMRKFEMFSVVQLNGLIHEAETSGETRYLSEMKEERCFKLGQEDNDPSPNG